MGNGNTDVGKKTAPRMPGQPDVSAGPSERINRQQGGSCGAMSQQRCDIGRGNQSAPQKFVQLVGYRDPRPRSEPVKR